MAWFRAAIVSAITQSSGNPADFAKSSITIDPYKQGYNWIIVPVGAAIFKALAGVRGALDPRSGTLVLFRFWEETPCPLQHVFAFGIHLEDDVVSHEVATKDYQDQMGKALAAKGMVILGMDEAIHGDTGSYCTDITIGFTKGKTPFVVTPTRLTKRFWTGCNQKKARYVEYRWPAKCRTCESEAHISAHCPWPEVTGRGRKMNLFNCRQRDPGWEDTSNGTKKSAPNVSGGFHEFGPKKGRALHRQKGKGQAKV